MATLWGVGVAQNHLGSVAQDPRGEEHRNSVAAAYPLLCPLEASRNPQPWGDRGSRPQEALLGSQVASDLRLLTHPV